MRRQIPSRTRKVLAADRSAANRNHGPRTINQLRGYRSVATRCDKREFVYLGTIDIASIEIWLRDPSKKTYGTTA